MIAPGAPKRETLVRPRLLTVLQGRWDRRVTALVAGAGFGKTTLVGQALAENRLDPRGLDTWVTCTADDGAASVLAGRLCAELGHGPPLGADPTDLAQALAVTVTNRAPVAVAFVLDDLHKLPVGSTGEELVRQLAERLPSNGHLVLASRRRPPVPLARLVSLGDAVQLTEAELAFDDAEVDAFAELRGATGERLRAAGRWPAIAELTLAAGADVVEDYLWEEALGRVDPVRRRRLAVVASLGRVDGATLDAAAGEPVDLPALVEGVPLARVDDQDGRVALHDLWTGHLDAELTDEERRTAQARAGAHLAARGEWAAAFRLLAAGEDWQAALDLVVRVCGQIYLPVAADLLAVWDGTLRRSPIDPCDPGLLLVQATLAWATDGDLSRVRDRYEAAARGYRDAGDVVGEGACLVRLFAIGYAQDDVDLMLTSVGRGFELDAEGHRSAAPLASIGRAGLADHAGDWEAARLELERTAPGVDDDWADVRDWMYADVLLSLGRADEALAVVENAARPAGGGPAAQPLRGLQVQALWALGRVDEASAMGLRLQAEAERDAPVTRRHGGRVLAARYHAFLGQREEACALLQTLDDQVIADLNFHRRRCMAEATVALLDRDEEAAVAALDALADPTGRISLGNKTVLRTLALVYVLRPEVRDGWDRVVLGPVHARARDLARALVRLREDGDLDGVRELAPIEDPGPVRTALPLPWSVELTAALEQVGRHDGRPLLVQLGATARPHLEALAADPQFAARTGAKRLVADVAHQPDGVVHVRLLGVPELDVDGSVAEGPWRRERVRELLAYLVVHRTTTREAVVDALWPDLDAEAGANNLRANLSHLLTVLQPERAPKEPSYFVNQQGRALVLTGVDHLEVDVWQLEDDLAEAEAAEDAGLPSLALAAYQRAVEHWRGPLLADSRPAWAEPESERLRRRFVDAANRAAELALAAGQPKVAADLADRVLALDPWSERAYRALATSQLDRGDRSAARATLTRARAMLDDLGVEPESATQMLERRLREHTGVL